MRRDRRILSDRACNEMSGRDVLLLLSIVLDLLPSKKAKTFAVDFPLGSYKSDFR